MTATSGTTGAAGNTEPPADPDVLVATVGFNPLPVWCAILHYRPQRLVLVHTAPAGSAPRRGTDYRQQSSLPYAESIRCLLEESAGSREQGEWPAGVTVDLVSWSVGPRQVASADGGDPVAEVSRIVGERPWRLNAESGTKAMTLTLSIEHSRRFPDRPDWQCSVRDGVVTTYGGGREDADTSLLSLDQIARLYGFSHYARSADLVATPEPSAEELERRRVGDEFEAKVAGRLLPMSKASPRRAHEKQTPASSAEPAERQIDEVWHSFKVRPAYPADGSGREYTEFDVVLRAGMTVIVVEAKALQADGHRTFGWRRANAAVVFGDHTSVVLVHPDGQAEPYSRRLRPDLEKTTIDCPLGDLEATVGEILSSVRERGRKSPAPERRVPAGSGESVLSARESYASEVLVASEGLKFSASRSAAGLCPGLRRLIVVSTARFKEPDKLAVYGEEHTVDVEAPQGLDEPTVDQLIHLIRRAGANGTVHVDVTGGQKITSVPLMQAAVSLDVPVTVLDSTEGRSTALNRPDWDRYVSPDLPDPTGFTRVNGLAEAIRLLRGGPRPGTDTERLISALREIDREGKADDPDRGNTPQRIAWWVDASLCPGADQPPVGQDAGDDSLWWPPVVAQIGRFQVAFLSPDNDGIHDPLLRVTDVASLGDRVFPALSMVTESFGDFGRLVVLVETTQKAWAGEAWAHRVRGIAQLEAAVRFVGPGKSTDVVYKLDGALRSFGLAWQTRKDRS